MDHIKALNECSEITKKAEEVIEYEESFDHLCIICGSNKYNLDKNHICEKCQKEFPVK